MAQPLYLARDTINQFEADDFEQRANHVLADQWAQQATGYAMDALQTANAAPPPPPEPAPLVPADRADRVQASQAAPAAPDVSAEPPAAPPPEPTPAPAPEPQAAPTPAPAPVDPLTGQPPVDVGQPVSAPTLGPSRQLPSTPLVDYARQAAQRAGIDPDLFVRQIDAESGFQPFRPDGTPTMSPAGAVGVAQIVPQFHPGVDPTDPRASLDYAANLMAQHVKQYGSYDRALVAYNGGAGAVQAYDAGKPYAESARYVSTILGGQQPSPPQDPAKATDLLSAAAKEIGKPYVWGGGGGGFDCSSFVSSVFGQFGVKLPAFTDAIAKATPPVSTQDARPGDIVLFQYQDPDQPGVTFPHTGIYLGNGQMIDAQWGKGVGIHPLLGTAMEFHRPAGIQAPSLDVVGAAANVATQAAQTVGEAKDGVLDWAKGIGDTLGSTIARLPTTLPTPPAPSTPPTSTGEPTIADEARGLIAPTAAAAPTGPSVVPLTATGLPDVNAIAQAGHTQEAGAPIAETPWQEYQAASRERQQTIEAMNPVRDVPVLGGAVTAAGTALTDPLTLAAGPEIGLAGGLAERAAAGAVAKLGLAGPAAERVVPWLAKQLAEGASWGAIQGSEQPDATAQSVAESILTGAGSQALLGGLAKGATQVVRRPGETAGAALGALDTLSPPREVAASTSAPPPGPGSVDWARANRSDPANATVGEMMQARPPEASLGSRFDQLVRAWTNRNEAADRYQQDTLRGTGYDLANPPEALDLSARLREMAGDGAAEVLVQNELKPAIRSLDQAGGPEAVGALSRVLIHENTIDVAKLIGQRVEQDVLGSDLGPIRGTSALQRTEASVRGLQRSYDAAVADAERIAAEQSVPGYNGAIDLTKAEGVQARLQQAQDRAAKLRTQLDQATRTAEAARSAQASQAGAQAAAERQFSGGLTVADSERALRSLQQELGPVGWQQVQQSAQQVQQFVGTLRQRMVDSGLISQDTADLWARQSPHWVPTRILDYLDESGGPRPGSKLSLSDPGVRSYTIEGTQKFREDPLGSLVGLAHQVETKARKNDAVNALVELDSLRPEGQRLLEPTDRPVTTGENVVQRLNNGTVERYVASPELATVINGPQISQAPGFVRAWTSFVRAVTTVLSPTFALVRNPSLDIPEYLQRELTRAGGNPAALPHIVSELVRGYADALQGLPQNEIRGAGAQQYLLGGGGSANMATHTVAERAAAVQALGRGSAFEIRDAGDLARIAKDLLTLRPVAAVAERTELGPRIASMRLAEQRGATPARAVLAGRTVTLDFNEGGTLAKTINSYIPFFNAGIQGSAQVVRAARENPVGFGVTTLGTVALPALAAEAWNNSDPQRARDYQDVPKYLKDQGIVVMMPGDAPVDAQGNRRPQFWWVNLRGYALFAVMAREATAHALPNAQPEDWAGLTSSLFWSGFPLRASNVADVPGSLMPEFVPGASTGLQLAVNKDIFRGSDIATARRDEQAAAASKAIAQNLTAVARMTNPAAQIRPSQVDFAIKDMLGGVGATALAGSDVIAGTPPRDTSVQSVPVVGGVARAIGVRGDTGQALQDVRAQGLSGEAQRVLNQAGMPAPSPVQPTVSVGKVTIPLLQAEQARYQQLVDQYASEQILKNAQPMLQTSDPTIKQKYLGLIVDDAKKRATADLLRGIPASELNRRAQDYSAKQHAPKP